MDKVLFVRFLEIQMQQNELMNEIASKNNLLQFWTHSVELSIHRRDCHNHFWDASISANAQKKLHEELELLYKQYKQNQEQLEAIRQQVFATFTS